MFHVNVGEIIEENKCHLEYDEQLQTHILDEDKLLDILETTLFDKPDEDCNEDDVNQGIKGNLVADYHTCEMFPERWFDLVLVLRVDTHVLYDRLEKRGYSEAKRSQNMECEIMQVVLDEAKESYADEIVIELKNNSIDEMDQNIERITSWFNQWIADHESS